MIDASSTFPSCPELVPCPSWPGLANTNTPSIGQPQIALQIQIHVSTIAKIQSVVIKIPLHTYFELEQIKANEAMEMRRRRRRMVVLKMILMKKRLRRRRGMVVIDMKRWRVGCFSGHPRGEE